MCVKASFVAVSIWWRWMFGSLCTTQQHERSMKKSRVQYRLTRLFYVERIGNYFPETGAAVIGDVLLIKATFLLSGDQEGVLMVPCPP